jgi:hypothetical protein
MDEGSNAETGAIGRNRRQRDELRAVTTTIVAIEAESGYALEAICDSSCDTLVVGLKALLPN